MTFAFGFGSAIYRQSVYNMRQFRVSTILITRSYEEVHLYSVKYAANIITYGKIMDR